MTKADAENSFQADARPCTMFSLLASLPPSAAAVAIGPHFVPSGSKRVWIGGRPAQPLRQEQRQSLLADLAEAVLAPSPFALVDIPKHLEHLECSQ